MATDFKKSAAMRGNQNAKGKHKMTGTIDKINSVAGGFGASHKNSAIIAGVEGRSAFGAFGYGAGSAIQGRRVAKDKRRSIYTAGAAEGAVRGFKAGQKASKAMPSPIKKVVVLGSTAAGAGAGFMRNASALTAGEFAGATIGDPAHTGKKYIQKRNLKPLKKGK